jgi:hypothetical protein
MTSCRACGAPLIWAERDTEVGGGGVARERIALDYHEVLGGDLQLVDGKAVPFEPSDRKPAFREHYCGVVVRRGARV